MGDRLAVGGRFSSTCPANRKLVMMRLMTKFRLGLPRLWTNRLLSRALPVVLVLMSPMTALAQDEAEKFYDGRLEGYPKNVTLEGGSTALTWILLMLLGAFCIGVLFKSARRTHLD